MLIAPDFPESEGVMSENLGDSRVVRVVALAGRCLRGMPDGHGTAANGVDRGSVLDGSAKPENGVSHESLPHRREGCMLDRQLDRKRRVKSPTRRSVCFRQLRRVRRS